MLACEGGHTLFREEALSRINSYRSPISEESENPRNKRELLRVCE